MVLGRFASDPIRRQLTAPKMMAAGGLLTAAGLGAGLAANTVASMLVGTGVAGLGLAGLSPVITSTAGALHPQSATSAVALVSGFNHLGFFVGPPMLGVVAQHVGLRLALTTVVAAGLSKVALAPLLARAIEARLPEPAPEV